MKLVMTKVILQAKESLSFDSWNSKVDEALKELYAILKKKGFVREKASKQSAMFEVTYRRESKGDAVGIDGWHGTGRYDGPKAIFEVHYYPKGNIYDASEEFTVNTNDVDSLSRILQRKKDYSEDLKTMEANLAKVKKFLNSL